MLDTYTLLVFLLASDALSTLPPSNSWFRTSLECCLDSSDVLGLLRLALGDNVSDVLYMAGWGMGIGIVYVGDGRGGRTCGRQRCCLGWTW